MFVVPAEAKDLTVEHLRAAMPPKEILEKWFRGEAAEWPPEDDFGDEDIPELRFQIGTKVQCRVGPTQWQSGTVIQWWYRESSWPESVYAPYKILLNSGKEIYAPQDDDRLIRLDPKVSAIAAAPSTRQT
jgi:hypothetical protein